MADIKWSQFPSATPGNSDEVVGLHSGNNARFTIANIVAAVRDGLANIFVPKTDVGTAGGVASLDNTGKVPTSQLPSSTGPEPATATPLMDGTGAVGTSTKYAREDHEHPTDTNKQAKITASGILKGDGQGGVSAATAGTDYQAPLTSGTDYATPAQLADKADKTDLSSIQATGSTNTTGSIITAGTYFYLNGVLVVAKLDIAVNASFTSGTNYETVTVGGLNSRRKVKEILLTSTQNQSGFEQKTVQNLNDFDFVRMSMTNNSNGGSLGSTMIPVSSFKQLNSSSNTFECYIPLNNGRRVGQAYYTNDTTIYIRKDATDFNYSTVNFYGITI